MKCTQFYGVFTVLFRVYRRKVRKRLVRFCARSAEMQKDSDGFIEE
jgi:hypothetical protein